VEPVSVTSPVRRTVRMAVALVIGQALLCALIGWLTLGASQEQTRRPGSPPVDQLAAPPPPGLPHPTASRPAMPRQVRPVRPALSRPASARPVSRPDRRTTPPPAPRFSPKPAPPKSAPPKSASPGPASPRPTLTPLPPVPPVPELPTPKTSAPSPPAGETVQEAVTIGDRCRPEGAYGRTNRGVLARCFSSWHHGPRWKIA